MAGEWRSLFGLTMDDVEPIQRINYLVVWGRSWLVELLGFGLVLSPRDNTAPEEKKSVNKRLKNRS